MKKTGLKSNFNKKVIKIIISIVIILLFVVLLIYGYKVKGWCYFFIPFYSLIQIMIAIVVTYYLAQRKTDQRKLKDVLSNLIEKLSKDINDDRMYIIKNDDDLKNIRIRQRSIFNKLYAIKEFNEFNIKNDIEYCIKEFNEYWDFISEHMDNLEYLINNSVTLNMHISNIDSKLDQIQISLYSNW